MEPRSQIIEHPSGITIKTPLLIPSFSSKGFGIKNGKSVISSSILISTEFWEDCMLISAFDLYYNLIPDPDEFAGCAEMVFIDSGGYETSSIYNFSGIIEYPGDSSKIDTWNIEKLESVIRKWSKRYPAVIVNFDHGNIRKPLKEQINEACSFFQKFPDMLNSFLIKPETKTQQYVQIKNILEMIHSFDEFDIISLTDKELGNSILIRMKNIHKIRTRLDEVNITKPIHIFGSLDPITSILYFLAGAEIFDGLTWLRFSYFNNSALYTPNFSVINKEIGISRRDLRIKADSIVNNLRYLNKLKFAMINFISSRDYSEFNISDGNRINEIIKQCYNTFYNSLKE